MDVFHQLAAAASHPNLYSTLIALIAAFYIAWAMARQQYLGVYQHFDVLALTLIFGIAGIFAGQIFFPGYLNAPWPPVHIAEALQRPFLITSLSFGYILAGLATWRYIRRIHYPFWRVMDTNVLAVSLIVLGWLLGEVIAMPSVPLAVAAGGWALYFVASLLIYQRLERPGLLSGLHVVAIAAMCGALQFTLVSWRGMLSIVEYSTVALGIFLGLVVIVIRLRVSVPHTALPQLPVGVSQKFRETFSRALLFRQPSNPDGSSHS
jgi:hypothetical protein